MNVKAMLSPNPVHKPCPANVPARIEPQALLAVSDIVMTLHAKPKQMTQKLPKGPFIFYCLPFSVFCLSHTKLCSSAGTDVSKIHQQTLHHTVASARNRYTCVKQYLHPKLSYVSSDAVLQYC